MPVFDDSAQWGVRSRALYLRLLLPILAAIVIILIAERAIQSYLQPGFWDKTAWLMHDPYRGEGFDRVIVQEKLQNLLKLNPDIISVGDSSGFFSLQPTIVNRYLDGKRYVNLSTGANMAFDGYKAIAEFALRDRPSIKYVVLQIFPQLVPSTKIIQEGSLSPILQDNLISFRAWLTPPSAALSPYAKTLLFEHRRYHRSDALSNHKVALELRATIDQTLGWTPEHDVRFDRLFGKTGFNLDTRTDWSSLLPGSDPSILRYYLSDFAKMVEKYSAKLIVVFSPVPQQLLVRDDANAKIAEQAVASFQQHHPDVKFLFPFITTFSSDKFAQFNHAAREYSFLTSKRLGLGLRKYFRDPASITALAVSHEEAPPTPKPEVQSRSGDDSALKDAAMSFFLYTATTEPRYRQQISRRVLALLDDDEAFGFMMDDATAKLELLARSKAKLSYNLDALKAMAVDVSNVSHCNAGDPSLQWVQLSGSVAYDYADPTHLSSAPVTWPAASYIIVPTIIEDGVRKFDGYCLEPSMAALEK